MNELIKKAVAYHTKGIYSDDELKTSLFQIIWAVMYPLVKDSTTINPELLNFHRAWQGRNSI